MNKEDYFYLRNKKKSTIDNKKRSILMNWKV